MADEVLPIKEEDTSTTSSTDSQDTQTTDTQQSGTDIVTPENIDSIRREVLSRPQRLSGDRIVHIKIFDDASAASTGDGKFIFFVPPEFNRLDLRKVYAYVTGASSSGALTVQVRSVTNSVDILSTAITIDESELSSLTAATQPVITLAQSTVREGDQIAIDVDAAGTSAEGLGVVLTFG